ncbi:hypothetical protein QBC40DRAFT_101337 [Triangularia verruculosa]|uniref:Aminoglycoside phosphotransferase domain-containing protein n=1 Tax=Triangularia verruculosa TaxID=2587418 RepID=A0AAN6XBF8_9PEZI|nr:hypothetical protein QBC40DRAFT_101337 [Triangularia verruculosa]
MSIESCHVRESIREINDNSWVIGGRILLSRQSSPPLSGTFWGDGTGSFYTITDAPHPPSEYFSLPATSPFEKVYDRGEVSAVWIIGEAVLKARRLQKMFLPATREHVTLNELKKRSLSFAIPEVYHHAEFDDRYYLFQSRIYGETLENFWVKMEETAKQNCISRMVSIIKELMVWQGPNISGVDGKHLPDPFILKQGPEQECSPDKVLRACQELGMDCSTFMFTHCDPAPPNIMVNDKGELIGIIDWEIAGFVPKAWIITKFYVSGGLDLPSATNDMDEREQWRIGVGGALALKERFPHCVQDWFRRYYPSGKD